MSLGGYNGFRSKRESGDCLDIMNVGKKTETLLLVTFKRNIYLFIFNYN